MLLSNCKVSASEDLFPCNSNDKNSTAQANPAGKVRFSATTMEGSAKSSYFVTMTDRRSRLASLRVVPNKSPQVVRKANARGLRSQNAPPVRTITTNNGREFAEHEQRAASLNTKTDFAGPYSSWERGSNENMKGLIRQYFPKGTDFRTIPPAALAHVERKLKNRPRKCPAFKTPIEVYYSPDNI